MVEQRRIVPARPTDVFEYNIPRLHVILFDILLLFVIHVVRIAVAAATTGRFFHFVGILFRFYIRRRRRLLLLLLLLMMVVVVMAVVGRFVAAAAAVVFVRFRSIDVMVVEVVVVVMMMLFVIFGIFLVAMLTIPTVVTVLLFAVID